MTGEQLPTNIEIDHINGIRHDNRWENLRSASRRDNRQNLKTYENNTSGYPGIFIAKDGRKKPFRPFISVDGKKMFLEST